MGHKYYDDQNTVLLFSWNTNICRMHVQLLRDWTVPVSCGQYYPPLTDVICLQPLCGRAHTTSAAWVMQFHSNFQVTQCGSRYSLHTGWCIIYHLLLKYSNTCRLTISSHNVSISFELLHRAL